MIIPIPDYIIRNKRKATIMENNGQAEAVKSIQAENNLNVDIVHLVETIVNVCTGKKNPTEAIKEVALENKDAAIFWAKTQATTFLEKKIKNSKQKNIQALSEKDFASRMVNSTMLIGDVIKRFYDKKINGEELIKELSNTGIKEVSVDVLEAIGIPDKLGVKDMNALFNLSANSMAFMSLTAAYKELRKALEDKEIAHQQRLIIEDECDRAVKAITSYRMEMEQVVSDYFSGYYDTFAVGFAEMDQAILDHDSDGYIKGNVTIQKVLGYHPQFTSQDGFDDLMLSDEAFKL